MVPAISVQSSLGLFLILVVAFEDIGARDKDLKKEIRTVHFKFDCLRQEANDPTAAYFSSVISLGDQVHLRNIA